MIIADSDTLIDSLRGRDPGVSRIAFELRSGSLSTTVVSAFELLSGAKTGEEKAKVETLLAAMAIVPMDEGAARTAASLRRDLEFKGSGLGMADYLIAGICLERSAILLTRNRDRFERIPGLAIGTLS